MWAPVQTLDGNICLLFIQNVWDTAALHTASCPAYKRVRLTFCSAVVIWLMLLYMPVGLLQQMFIYTEISIEEKY